MTFSLSLQSPSFFFFAQTTYRFFSIITVKQSYPPPPIISTATSTIGFLLFLTNRPLMVYEAPNCEGCVLLPAILAKNPATIGPSHMGRVGLDAPLNICVRTYEKNHVFPLQGGSARGNYSSEIFFCFEGVKLFVVPTTDTFIVGTLLTEDLLVVFLSQVLEFFCNETRAIMNFCFPQCLL